jgi:hypothetical protein
MCAIWRSAKPFIFASRIKSLGKDFQCVFFNFTLNTGQILDLLEEPHINFGDVVFYEVAMPIWIAS